MGEALEVSESARSVDLVVWDQKILPSLPAVRLGVFGDQIEVYDCKLRLRGFLTADFSRLTCEACRVGAPPAIAEEMEQLLAECPDWESKTVAGTPQIRRVFKFDDFVPWRRPVPLST